MTASAPPLEIQIWPIDRLVLYARNPRKNDAVVDRMSSSIREFGFKIPVLARSEGKVVNGHLRIKVAQAAHRSNPCDPVRRMDAGAGKGIPIDGEPLGQLGIVGR